MKLIVLTLAVDEVEPKKFLMSFIRFVFEILSV